MENVILSNLLYNEKYTRKVLPFLKDDYFHNKNEKQLFEIIRKHIIKYNSSPTKESIYIDISDTPNLDETSFHELTNIVQNLEIDETTNLEWLVDKTEEFCQEKALFNAISKSINVIDSGEKTLTKAAIPQLLQEALQVSFDLSVGHDYLEDVASRIEMYHEKTNHLPSGINLIDLITKGGFISKALYCFMAPSGVGKSLIMASLASNILRSQKNVLYISMEMAEEMVGERIDGNILDMEVDRMKSLSATEFQKRFEMATRNIKGKLVIREYPPTTASAATFEALLSELKLKKNFVPDIIFVDYLNICASTRYKAGTVNSYTLVKAVAEELRAIGAKWNIPIVTATQVNRGGTRNMDLDMEDVADSYGLVMTTDLLIGVTQDEELEERGLYLFKQIKNRYYPTSKPRRFMVGVDKSKMKLFDVDQTYNLQDGPEKDEPIMDNTKFGSEDNNRNKPKLEGFV